MYKPRNEVMVPVNEPFLLNFTTLSCLFFRFILVIFFKLLVLSNVVEMNKTNVTIYTDGACSGNPGLGGWAAVILIRGQRIDIYGREARTTNNKMELTAVIEGLETLKTSCDVNLYTDSIYIKNGITDWINKWKINGWKTGGNNPVKNMELWKTLNDISSLHKINWHWVKGHEGNEYNEVADSLARNALKNRDQCALLGKNGSANIKRDGNVLQYIDEDESIKMIETQVTMYTDGACSGNPGPGGWAAVILSRGSRADICGREESTTNNRMELTAVINGLQTMKTSRHVDLYTDSIYVKNGITEWIHNWKVNGWQTSDNKPVKNIDLWETLSEFSLRHKINWHWVKAHDGNKYNEAADFLARNALINKFDYALTN